MAIETEKPAAPATPLRRVGRDTVIYGSAILLTKLASFVMLPIYTRYLTPADYGTLQLITTTLDVIEIFAGARLVTGIFYFFHKVDTERDRRKVLSSTFAVLAASYLTAGAAAYAGASFLARLVFGGAGDPTLLQIAAVSLASNAMLVVPMAYLQVAGQSIRFVAVGLSRLVLQVTFNLFFLVVLHLGVKAVLLSTMITNLMVGAVLLAYFLGHVGLGMSGPATRALLRFGLPLVAVNVATFISTFGDRYFLQAAADTTVVGIYSLAYQFGFLLAMVGYVPFNTVWEPTRFAIAKRPDRDDVYARGFVYFNVLLLSAAVVFALFVATVLRIMAAPSYWSAADLVPVILIAYVLQGWTEIHNLGIMMQERTELLTWANWAAALVAVVGYAWLIPRYLGMGAAVATVLAFGVREVLVYVWSQRLWPVRYRWAPVLRLTTVALLVCVARTLVPQGGMLHSVAWSLGLLAVYGVGLLYAGVLSKDEREVVYGVLRSPRTAFLRFVAGS